MNIGDGRHYAFAGECKKVSKTPMSRLSEKRAKHGHGSEEHFHGDGKSKGF